MREQEEADRMTKEKVTKYIETRTKYRELTEEDTLTGQPNLKSKALVSQLMTHFLPVLPHRYN